MSTSRAIFTIKCSLTAVTDSACYCHIVCVNAAWVLRYIQLNVQFSEAYRVYNKELPAFLHNRPRDFVEHVCKRWTSAGDMPASNVRQLTDVDFAVTSSDSGNVYRVHLGQHDTMPFCECYDWSRSHWPCKHMLSIFRHTQYSWDDLCLMYRDSPFFGIDSELFDMEPSFSQTAADDTQDVSYVDDDVDVHGDSEEHHQPPVTSLAARCRERLRWLQDATYICTDHTALSSLDSDLQQSCSRLSKSLPHDSGLTLQLGEIPRRKASLKNLRRRKAAQVDESTSEGQRDGVSLEEDASSEAAVKRRHQTTTASSRRNVKTRRTMMTAQHQHRTAAPATVH